MVAAWCSKIKQESRKAYGTADKALLTHFSQQILMKPRHATYHLGVLQAIYIL